MWRKGVPVGTTGRWLFVLWGVFLLAGFGLAAMVVPDPRGFGTHQRFGLPPCSMIAFFEIPCPSCGMTTSFAHFVRGEWASAARANPAGLVLAILFLIQLPWSVVSAACGRMWLISRPERTFLAVMTAVFLVALIQWAVRIALPG